MSQGYEIYSMGNAVNNYVMSLYGDRSNRFTINSNRFVDITALNTCKTYDNGPRKKKGGIFVRPLYYT